MSNVTNLALDFVASVHAKMEEDLSFRTRLTEALFCLEDADVKGVVGLLSNVGSDEERLRLSELYSRLVLNGELDELHDYLELNLDADSFSPEEKQQCPAFYRLAQS